jgi:hypothetical protein
MAAQVSIYLVFKMLLNSLEARTYWKLYVSSWIEEKIFA